MGALRDLRGPRRHRRHLGPVPVPGHPLRLRHVHARLLVPAVGRREGHRRRRLDPAVHQGHRRPRRASTSTSASTTASSRADWSTDDARWHVTAERTDTGETGRAHLPASSSRAAATTATTTATSPTSPAWTASRARSSTRRPGPRTSTTPASGSSSSAAAPPRSRSSRRWPRRPAHVTMLQRSPTLHRLAAGQGPARRRCCARSCPTRVAGPAIRWFKALDHPGASTSSASAGPSW